MSLTEILARVSEYAVPRVTVTGGEPLAQPGCIDLLTALCDAGNEVSLETSGALDVANVDARVVKVVDLKTPGSAEVGRNHWENLEHCGGTDQVKFVIANRADYDWACEKMNEHDLTAKCPVLFSPVWDEEGLARHLAEWILADRTNVRFQVQLHKILWGDRPGH